MAGRGSARRYAQAVFEIALERDDMDQWQGDLEALASAMQNALFRSVLESPKVRPDVKLELVQKQLSGSSPLALNLASLLVTKVRAGLAPQIADEFRNLVNAHRGLQSVEVTAALPLDDTTKGHIAEQLAQATGKEISLSTDTDSDLIGGLVVKIGDRLLDGSTRTKLEELKKTLVS